MDKPPGCRCLKRACSSFRDSIFNIIVKEALLNFFELVKNVMLTIETKVGDILHLCPELFRSIQFRDIKEYVGVHKDSNRSRGVF